MSNKGRNYLPAEQETLCRAWLHVSLDPIVGNDQKSSTFYEKVAAVYNDKHEARTPGSLQIHWRDNIQKHVSLFCGAYKKALHNPPSGTNNNDHLKTAIELYRVRSKKSTFRLHHCWLILKDAPKWQESMASSDSMPIKPYNASLNENHADYAERAVENTVKSSTLASIRPMGNKKAKAKSQDEVGIFKVQADMVKAIHERNAIARENSQLKMFTVRVDPDDAAASAFIAAKRRSAMLDIELEIETKRQKVIALRRANDGAAGTLSTLAQEPITGESDDEV
ncbi:hypothetical protein AaE_016098 [Aphanomyces astaci]|uniref:No apical meristem-associated C-terminal domain-containing protein n=1 Tax=Aphanomyces astaci TaxID=112090 RepID=A0A6A4YZP6_APHAT|nr:hypothetical protein AaE_016098 [Aphanomyces astaci]